MELSAVLGFAVVALTLIVVPGPDWAYVLAVGARDHVVLPVVTGVLGGAGYLICLVVRALRSSGRLEQLGGGGAPAAPSSR